jgi:hypothetical protein
MRLLRPFLFILTLLSIQNLLQAQSNDSIRIIPMVTGPNDTTLQKSAPVPIKTFTPPRKDSFWRRIAVGGNLGFQFGSITGINVSPEARIRIIDQLYLGVGFIYQYFKVNDYFFDTTNQEFVSYSSNTFGGRLYARYYLSSLFENWVGNFFAHSEYEYLHYVIPFEYDPNGRYIDVYTGLPYSKGREIIDIHSVLLGGGYRQPIAGRAFIDFLILFNLNDTPYSPYTNPIFRLGVGVGL